MYWPKNRVRRFRRPEISLPCERSVRPLLRPVWPAMRAHRANPSALGCSGRRPGAGDIEEMHQGQDQARCCLRYCRSWRSPQRRSHGLSSCGQPQVIVETTIHRRGIRWGKRPCSSPKIPIMRSAGLHRSGVAPIVCWRAPDERAQLRTILVKGLACGG